MSQKQVALDEPKAPNVAMAVFKQYFGIILVLRVLLIIGAILSFHVFFTWSNFSNVLRQASIVGILAVGETFVILTGNLDISVGSNMILSSIVAATFLKHYGNMPAIIIALVVGTVFGMVNAFLIVRFELPSFITTLGMMSVGTGVGLIYSNANFITAYTPFFSWLGGGYVFGAIPIPVVVFAVIVVIALIIEKRTVFGRYIYAIGGNEEAANLSAINTRKIKFIVFTLSGFLSGLAAIVLLARMGSASSETGTGSEMDAIAAVVIGGTSMAGGIGSVGGSVVGIIILQIVDNLLNLLNVPSFTQDAFKGAIIIISIIIYQTQQKRASKVK